MMQWQDDGVLETGVQQKPVTPSKNCPAPNTGVDQESGRLLMSFWIRNQDNIFMDRAENI